MKRTFQHTTWAAALALVFCQTGCGAAGQPADQQAPSPSTSQSPSKKSTTGSVGQINPKQHTITVKPLAASQQIQVQSGAQKAKEKPAEDLLLLVDEQTQITRAGFQKGAAGVAKKRQDLFGLLAVGQLVRVVYEEPVAETAQGPAQKAPAQKVPAPTTPAEKVPPKETDPVTVPATPVASKDDEPPVPTPVEESATAATAPPASADPLPPPAPAPAVAAPPAPDSAIPVLPAPATDVRTSAAPVTDLPVPVPATAAQPVPAAEKVPVNSPKPLRAVSIEILVSASPHAKDVDAGEGQP